MDSLVEILQLNHQYDDPEVEGPDAMKRVAHCDAAIFLVAEKEQQLCGLIKAVYDGSRAIIHLIHPQHQHAGIGSALVEAVKQALRQRGTPSLSVTVTEKSAGFWEQQGFQRLPVFLMLAELK